MSTYRRNVAVGVTVLASLLMLGWMILRFGANIAKPFAGEMVPIKFVTDRADGVSDGSAVTFRGVTVGHVIRVWRDANQHDIWADAEVDALPPLPAKLTAGIRQGSLLGSGSNMVLEAAPDSTGDLKPGTVIKAEFIGLDLIPPELKAIGPELTAIAKQFKDENFVANLNARVTQAGKMIDEANKTLVGINGVVNDEQTRTDLRAAMANIRTASENAKSVTAKADALAGKADAIAANVDAAVTTVNATAKTAQTKVDALSQSVQSRLDQAAVTLEQVAQITTKINAGTGTAGKLVNDPKLYAGLADTTDELNAAVKDLRRLLQQWEQEGISAKLR